MLYLQNKFWQIKNCTCRFSIKYFLNIWEKFFKKLFLKPYSWLSVTVKIKKPRKNISKITHKIYGNTNMKKDIWKTTISKINNTWNGTKEKSCASSYIRQGVSCQLHFHICPAKVAKSNCRFPVFLCLVYPWVLFPPIRLHFYLLLAKV